MIKVEAIDGYAVAGEYKAQLEFIDPRADGNKWKGFVLTVFTSSGKHLSGNLANAWMSYPA